jgi:hypothetical protein
MPGKHWGWDAKCQCGWQTRTGGAIQERIKEEIAEHLWNRGERLGLKPSDRGGGKQMYEVKVTFRFDNIVRQVTLASFEGELGAPNYSRGKALAFAKQIDPGFAVDVVYVPEEDNREANFGLVYRRDAAF